jgi:predicted nucleic acid-binding protein
MMAALAECESRGVRGGAVYDWLHLAAARQAGAQALVTLDRRDFQALSRPGDPRIESP